MWSTKIHAAFESLRMEAIAIRSEAIAIGWRPLLLETKNKESGYIYIYTSFDSPLFAPGG